MLLSEGTEKPNYSQKKHMGTRAKTNNKLYPQMVSPKELESGPH